VQRHLRGWGDGAVIGSLEEIWFIGGVLSILPSLGSVQSIKLTVSEDELEEHSVGNHGHHKEGEGQGSW